MQSEATSSPASNSYRRVCDVTVHRHWVVGRHAAACDPLRLLTGNADSPQSLIEYAGGHPDRLVSAARHVIGRLRMNTQSIYTMAVINVLLFRRNVREFFSLWGPVISPSTIMSDTKKKDGANSTATPKRPSKGAKGVCEILSKIFTLVSEIKDDPAGFEEHESIVANLDSLKKQIDEKDEKSKIAIDDKDKKIESLEKEISDLNTHKQRMWDEFDAKYTDFIKKTGNHETLQERLQQVMAELEQSNDRYEKAKQVNEDVKKDLDVCKAELDNTKSRLKSLEKERERLDLELRTSVMREQELHDDLGLNKLEDISLAD